MREVRGAGGGLTQVVQQLLGSVLGGLQVEELLVLVDELGVHGGVEELVVGQDVLQEGDVGLGGGERERVLIQLKLQQKQQQLGHKTSWS